MIIKTNDYTPSFLSEPEKNGFAMFGGLVKLDRSNLICIAARPGMGKTALELHMALEYAKKCGKRVHILTLEMSAEQIYSRMLCYLSEVDTYSMRKKKFSPEEKKRIEEAIDVLGGLDIIIDDETSLSIRQIEERLEKSDGEDEIGMIVIDYLELVQPVSPITNRKQELAEILRRLKRLAEKRNIPVIVAAKLWRDIEHRKDKHPMLSDFARVSDYLPDTVVFPYRDEYYNAECNDSEDFTKAEIIVAKNSHGSTGTLKYKWQGRYAKFSEIKEKT